MRIQIDIAPGELIDKLTILEIKEERIGDAGKLANIQREKAVLKEAAAKSGLDLGTVAAQAAALKSVNEQLWEIEDEIREQERKKDFGPRFIELARAVYQTNDRRAALKGEINDAFGSDIREEKSYAAY